MLSRGSGFEHSKWIAVHLATSTISYSLEYGIDWAVTAVSRYQCDSNGNPKEAD